MRVLAIFCHPRRDSFCGSVLDALVDSLEKAGHQVEIADLHAEGFDPRMTEVDEPDRIAVGKRYSEAVIAEQQRVDRSEALVFIFPVWWWSFPAMLKGWIDRVWNRDWAYGAQLLSQRSCLLIGTASAGEATYAKYGYADAMRTQLVTGVVNYCGIREARLELLYDSTGEAETRDGHLATVRSFARFFE